MIRRKQIQSRVHELLKAQGVTDAPVDVESLAKAVGAEVRFVKADDDLSGFLYCGEEDEATIIGVNADHHRKRQRFTIAHEVGHLCLHSTERFHYDDRSGGFVVHLRSPVSGEGVDRLEIEANTFAAELLMPSAFLERDLQGVASLDVFEEDPTFERLTKKYDVSRRALAIRLAHLGYISELP